MRAPSFILTVVMLLSAQDLMAARPLDPLKPAKPRNFQYPPLPKLPSLGSAPQLEPGHIVKPNLPALNPIPPFRPLEPNTPSISLAAEKLEVPMLPPLPPTPEMPKDPVFYYPITNAGERAENIIEVGVKYKVVETLCEDGNPQLVTRDPEEEKKLGDRILELTEDGVLIFTASNMPEAKVETEYWFENGYLFNVLGSAEKLVVRNILSLEEGLIVWRSPLPEDRELAKRYCESGRYTKTYYEEVVETE